MRSRNLLILGSIIFLTTLIVGQNFVLADTATELREKISNYNEEIDKLDAEIAKYEKQLTTVGAEKQTLQKAINELNVTRQKFSTEIQKTENQISKTNLTIDQLSDEINDKESRITSNKSTISETLRKISFSDDVSTLETLLAYDNISDFWGQISELQEVQASIQESINELEVLKKVLSEKKQDTEEQKKELITFQKNLSYQKQAVDETKKNKDILLTQTANKESNYQALLAERKKTREEFEQLLQDFESQLQYILDPNSIPQQGTAVFSWPFNTSKFNPFAILTQEFGGTAFAKNNPQVYGRPFHNGTDFGLPSGTPLYSTASGTVRGTGNTDVGSCLSYGKWVLVDHENGLTTLYAHLSSVTTQSGQNISTSDIIGYSGNTGYSTGPHLHLTVFARDAVQIKRSDVIFGKTNCGLAQVYLPVASTDAYFDPMSYLPKN